jgi:hypothetical protein
MPTVLTSDGQLFSKSADAARYNRQSDGAMAIGHLKLVERSDTLQPNTQSPEATGVILRVTFPQDV